VRATRDAHERGRQVCVQRGDVRLDPLESQVEAIFVGGDPRLDDILTVDPVLVVKGLRERSVQCGSVAGTGNL